MLHAFDVNAFTPCHERRLLAPDSQQSHNTARHHRLPGSGGIVVQFEVFETLPGKRFLAFHSEDIKDMGNCHLE